MMRPLALNSISGFPMLEPANGRPRFERGAPGPALADKFPANVERPSIPDRCSDLTWEKASGRAAAPPALPAFLRPCSCPLQ